MSELRPLTLDLAESARYSLHFLSHNLDPEYKWYTCHKTFYDADPPYHQHTLWDHCETPARYLYGIVFARQLIGPNEIKDAEKKIKRNVYRQFDCNDGLVSSSEDKIFRALSGISTDRTPYLSSTMPICGTTARY